VNAAGIAVAIAKPIARCFRGMAVSPLLVCADFFEPASARGLVCSLGSV
jgi:hypothetical protein